MVERDKKSDKECGGEIETLQERYMKASGSFQPLREEEGPGPSKSIEGWLLMVTNIHEEAQEDDIFNAFSKHGAIKNLNLNLDRRTGYAKGYALIEFEEYEQAKKIIKAMNDVQLLGKVIKVDWAFKKPPKKGLKY